MIFHHFSSENTLHVKSSIDTSTSKQDSKDLAGTLSMTMYGGGSGMGATLGYGEGHQSSDSTTNTNSELLAKNINITTTNDASFKGATVKADDTLNVKVGGGLSVESQRDSSSSNSKGFNVSVSASLGKDKDYTANQSDYAKPEEYKAAQDALNKTAGARIGNGLGSTGASFGANTGTSQSKQTVLSSLTGENVNVEVEGNTHIKGALIAAGKTNEQGVFEDNEKLKLKTDTLTFANSSNTQFSSSNSFNVGASIGYGNAKDAKPSTTPAGNDAPKSDTQINSSSLSLSNQMGYSGSKTLATLGKGDVQVGDTENSDDLTRLNRDTTKVNKDLYSGNVGTSVTAVLDHRLLTEDGQDQIKQDVKEITKYPENAYDTMFIKEAPLYEVFKDENGEIIMLKVPDEERQNLKKSSDGKVYVANNGIFNDALAGAGYALQHKTNDGPLYLEHFPKAEYDLSELLVAGYQFFLETTMTPTNATKDSKSLMDMYGQTGLVLSAHSRGTLTETNAMYLKSKDADAVGSLSNTQVYFYGPAQNVSNADELLSYLQNRDSMTDLNAKNNSVIKYQNHTADPVGTIVGRNPSTGGTIPEGSNTLIEMVRAAMGEESTSHNTYGEANKEDIVKFWGGKILVPVSVRTYTETK
ncbi:hemagglutinin repeat-containing protein [Sulfurospirillum arsenophilum]|uniref:hemagglutinin repeat-containing protein n=1 Tax=Sulfurospirillum arsenophilum TaxID=56698 RepID=UPI0005A7C07F|nr:hemagglutinin repeat-containing protein [Sulfurospirillum arsenophilum]